MGIRASMRRWHAWLAWLVGIPILLWTLSGFVMAARPIAEVRGESLLRAPQAVVMTTPPVLPDVAGLPFKSLSLEPRAEGLRWVADLPGAAGSRLADPATGAWLPRLGAAEGPSIEINIQWQKQPSAVPGAAQFVGCHGDGRKRR